MMYVYLEVYVHMIAHISTRRKYVCIWEHNDAGISTRLPSRLDSDVHTVYEMMNDDESLD